MPLKRVSVARLVIASSVLALALSTACEDDTPFTAREPGWEFLGLDGLKDSSDRVLVLERPYLYVCSGTDGLYRGTITRARPRWEYLGFSGSTMGEYVRASEQTGDSSPDSIYGTGVRHAAVLDNGDILLGMDYWRKTDSGRFQLAGLYRSEDMGVSWQRSDSGATFLEGQGRGIERLAVSPCDNGVVFAGSDSWVFRSVDRGLSWTPAVSMGFVEDVKVHPLNCSVWVGASTLREWGLLFRSLDGGLSWGYVSPTLDIDGVWPYGIGVQQIELDPTDPSVLYVVCAWGGISKTEDGGTTWETPFFSSRERYGSILLDPRDTDHLFIGFGAVVRESHDGGETYERHDVPDGSEIRDMKYDGLLSQLYVATDSGIYRYRAR